MKHLTAITLLLVTALSAKAVTETTANNGNLLMQDVPSIPQELVNELKRYQNVRSAPFRAFSNDNQSILITTHD